MGKVWWYSRNFFLQFYNGATTGSPPLGDSDTKYCGSTAPTLPETSSLYLTVQFVSDGAGDGSGFRMIFQVNCLLIWNVLVLYRGMLIEVIYQTVYIMMKLFTTHFLFGTQLLHRLHCVGTFMLIFFGWYFCVLFEKLVFFCFEFTCPFGVLYTNLSFLPDCCQ